MQESELQKGVLSAPGSAKPWLQAVTRAPSTPIVGITLAWLLVIWIVNPRGDFTLNDDWAYTLMVRRFLETGQISPSSWTYVPSITNVWIGATAAKLFGLSNLVLRCSTLFCGWVGALGIYALLRTLRQSRATSSLSTLIYVLSPIYLGLSFTFMTDIAFAAFLTWAVVGCTWGFQGRRIGFLLAVVGTGLATIARQPAIALGLAIIAASLLRYATNLKRLTWIAAAGSVLGLLALFAFDKILALERFQISTIIHTSLAAPGMRTTVTKQLVEYVLAAGLMLGPLVPLLDIPRGRSLKITVGLAALLAAGTVAVVLRYHLETPTASVGNIVGRAGIGPQIMHGGLTPSVLLSPGLRWFLMLLGASAGAWLISATVVRLLQGGLIQLLTSPVLLTPLLFCLIYLVPNVIRYGFDRYILPIAPAILILLPFSQIRAPSRMRVGLATFWGASAAVFGMLGTIDYFNNHRIRHELINAAKSEFGAMDEDIEGGFEFNGDRNYYRQRPDIHARFDRRELDHVADEPRYMLSLRADSYSLEPASWSFADDYLVSMAPQVAGYQRVREKSYFRWLTLRDQHVYLHEHQPVPKP